ncbi:hypothetical protein AMK10_20470 [Streptomyces sp. CB02058]|nr:hypothetical protein AMK10_20470 [Streptomyces sp. CB02058]
MGALAAATRLGANLGEAAERRAGPASGGIGTAVGTENDLVQGLSVLTRFSYSRRALPWSGFAGRPWPPSSGWRWMRSWRYVGDGADAQDVALVAPYRRSLVERGGLRIGGAEVVGDLARHVERDQRMCGRVPLDGGVVGQEVGDGGSDRAAADPVVAGGAAIERPSRCAVRTSAAVADSRTAGCCLLVVEGAFS